jgi:beta-phosphoglucomutase family hydrolase
MRTCHAVLFDLDGVVVDSSAAHGGAWQALFAECGVPFGPADYLARAAGHPREAVLKAVLGELPPEEHARLMQRKVELVQVHIEAHGIPQIPGTAAFVDALDEARVPYAIATSSRTPEILLAGAGLAGRFEVIVHRGMVNAGKPQPDLFIEAARRLGTPPARCLVLEDAAVGVQAARAAGCAVIGVGSGAVASRLGDADRIVHRLDTAWLVEGWLTNQEAEQP